MDYTKYTGLVEDYEPKNTRRRVTATKAKPTRGKTVKNSLKIPVKTAAITKRYRMGSAISRARYPIRTVQMSTVSKTKRLQAYRTIKEVISLPVFLISAHACLCPFGEKCFGADIKQTTTLPANTFLINFAQSGDATCLDEEYLNRHIKNVVKYLYVHSQSDIAENPSITKFSFFSGIRRAVGPIEYPNINYTMNETITKPDGTKVLAPRSKNPYGVYELTSKIFNNADTFKARNNTMSIIPQDKDRNDWTLEQIISEVYKKKKITSAIFISGGCLTSCVNPEGKSANVRNKVSRDITRYGELMDIANAEYVNLRETFTAEELAKFKHEGPMNLGAFRLQAFPQPSEYAGMLEEGLMDPTEFSKLPALVHAENKPTLEKFMGKSFSNV
jgi:hypothetical protein